MEPRVIVAGLQLILTQSVIAAPENKSPLTFQKVLLSFLLLLFSGVHKLQNWTKLVICIIINYHPDG